MLNFNHDYSKKLLFQKFIVINFLFFKFFNFYIIIIFVNLGDFFNDKNIYQHILNGNKTKIITMIKENENINKNKNENENENKNENIVKIEKK